jgi:thymidylate kinase
MMILVEGVTCSGKTMFTARLYRYLREFNTVELLHRSRPEERTRRWVLTDYVLNVEDYIPSGEYDILADRWHYGEVTYAPLYRPETNKDGFGLLGRSGWRWVELFLLSRGAIVIRLDADDDVLVQRLHNRGDDDVNDEQELLTLAQSYRETNRYSPSTVLQLDTSRIDVVDVQLDEYYFAALQAETAAKTILDVTHDYVGNPRPDVLLVGDRRNITKKYGEETRLPFMPVDQSSGVYLMESLPEDFWPQVGLVNGNDVRASLRDLWEALGRPRPVALGNPAARALTQAGFDEIEFTRLRHPAFVRRFRHTDQVEYGESIMAAAEKKGTYA